MASATLRLVISDMIVISSRTALVEEEPRYVLRWRIQKNVLGLSLIHI